MTPTKVKVSPLNANNFPFTDGDGKKELVIGYSDRRVRSYRWQEFAADTLSNSATTTSSAAGSGNLSGGKFIHVESWRLEGQVSSHR